MASGISEAPRYSLVPEGKAGGATYTPNILADFVACQIVNAIDEVPVDRPLQVIDPAIGDGELLVSLLKHLAEKPVFGIEVYGFETDEKALNIAATRLKQYFPSVEVNFRPESFIEFVLEHFNLDSNLSLFGSPTPLKYDIIIANPPYVRTQIIGATKAKNLAKQFGLTGRIDLYHAFVLAMSEVLRPKGVGGIIVSNRFMTTKSGASVRNAFLQRFNLRHAWDLGDSKLFDAAVLPAVLLIEGKNCKKIESPKFTSIYQTSETASKIAANPIAALTAEGVVGIDDGRYFNVKHGKLSIADTPNGVWRIGTKDVLTWLAKVDANKWGTFRDVGKIRVGVKTCADKVFIRDDWIDMPAAARPELLRPLITHNVACRFKPINSERPKQILYTHEIVEGRRRAVDLSQYPNSKAYLESHRTVLEGRKYVSEAGRKWYEIWVPQDPGSWNKPKLVFRDIVEEPTFWIDLDGYVVNGDCYWLICENPKQTDLLWLAAAVANSTFIERFYDHCFHNKLYSGRRRFITQYVEKFPLPDPHGQYGRFLIDKAKRIYECSPSSEADRYKDELNLMVWEAFGLAIEEVSR
jgi:adenine-specific DNA-methyltransferase